jgi:hypothetical protein
MAMTKPQLDIKYGKIIGSYPSKSTPNKVYEVRMVVRRPQSVYNIQNFSCNCQGWARRRICRHVKIAQTLKVSAYLKTLAVIPIKSKQVSLPRRGYKNWSSELTDGWVNNYTWG